MIRLNALRLLALLVSLTVASGAYALETTGDSGSNDHDGSGTGGGSSTTIVELEKVTVTYKKDPEPQTVTVIVLDFGSPTYVSPDRLDAGVPSTRPAQGQPSTGEKKADEGTSCSKAGNPVNFSTGNKIEPEVDIATRGEFPLELTRTYNRYWSGIGIFGRYWLSSYDYKLLLTSDKASSACYPKPGSSPVCDATGQSIWAQRADGRVIKFDYAAPGAWNETKASPIARIVKNGNGTYTLYSEDHTIETYDASGFPLTLRNERGVGWTFSWSASHYLNAVTHSSGRTVTLGWSGNQLASATDPAGNVYAYSYQANKFGTGQHLLTQTIQPGVANPTATGGTAAVTRTYQYERSDLPGALTGVTLNGARYSWFDYDSSGRAVLTRHFGTADQYQFAYVGDGSGGVASATVTNPLGRQTTYTYQAGQLVSTSGAATSNCAATLTQTLYDANGNPWRTIDAQCRDRLRLRCQGATDPAHRERHRGCHQGDDLPVGREQPADPLDDCRLPAD